MWGGKKEGLKRKKLEVCPIFFILAVFWRKGWGIFAAQTSWWTVYKSIQNICNPWKGELMGIAKSINPGQPVQSTQSDPNRNFWLLADFLCIELTKLSLWNYRSLSTCACCVPIRPQFSRDGSHFIISKICLIIKDWLIDCKVFSFSTVIQFYCCGQFTCPCFPGVLLTSAPHNTLSKPLAAFPHNHCRNNWQQWERNESCCIDYHQSSERMLAELHQ